jgi:hypothetical protein
LFALFVFCLLSFVFCLLSFVEHLNSKNITVVCSTALPIVRRALAHAVEMQAMERLGGSNGGGWYYKGKSLEVFPLLHECIVINLNVQMFHVSCFLLD